MRVTGLLSLACIAALAASGSARAQETGFGGSSSSAQIGNTSMAALIRDGYEIKAAAPTGSKFVVFLQKEGSGYACEFVTLTNSRCGEIE